MHVPMPQCDFLPCGVSLFVAVPPGGSAGSANRRKKMCIRDRCMQKTVAFSKVWLSGGDIPAEMDKEIKEFLSE